jgi:phage head maturation protease
MSTQNVVRKTASSDKSPSKREGRTRRFVVCTNDVDRDLDIVEPGGLDWGDHDANPIVLYSHAFMTPPVGKVVAHGLSADKSECWADIMFAPTDQGDELLKLADGGYLRGASLGFKPLEMGPPDWRYSQNRVGQGQAPLRHIRAAKVLEISIVNIPANARALMKAFSTGLITTKALRDQLFSEATMPNNTTPAVAQAATRITDAIKSLVPTPVLVAANVTQKVQAAVASPAFQASLADRIANEVELAVSQQKMGRLGRELADAIEQVQTRKQLHAPGGPLSGTTEAHIMRFAGTPSTLNRGTLASHDEHLQFAGKAAKPDDVNPHSMEGQRRRLGLPAS